MVTSMLKSDFAKKFYNISTETLRKWMQGKPELKSELEAIGYNYRSKLLKPREIALIREHFG